jgi:transcription elongation GreA/GreB family factor
MTNSPSGPTPDSITVGSRICVSDLDSGEEFHIRLVPPDATDPQNEKLSYKTPLGAALLGYRTGDVVHWAAPSRLRRFRIRSVCNQDEVSDNRKDINTLN